MSSPQPPSSNPFGRVVGLNNKATQYMQTREYGKAMEILSHAVHSLRLAQQQEPNNHNNPKTNENDDGDDTFMEDNDENNCLSLVEFVSTTKKSSLFEQEDDDEETCWNAEMVSITWNYDGSTSLPNGSTSFTNINAAFPISKSLYLCKDAVCVMAERALASEYVVELLSYAVFYNMALCNHLGGLQLASSPSSTASPSNGVFFERAIVFYANAQTILNEFGDVLFPNDTETMIHSLAITNNLGHVHLCLNHEPIAKLCFQRLLNAILYLSLDNSTSSSTYNATSNEERQSFMAKHHTSFQGFLTNVLHRLVASPLHAAAA